MLKIYLLSIFMIMTLINNVMGQQQVDINEVLGQLEAADNSIQDYTAEAVKELKSFPMPPFKGKMNFKAPNKLYFEYYSPYNGIDIVDGEFSYSYIAEGNKGFIVPIDKSDVMSQKLSEWLKEFIFKTIYLDSSNNLTDQIYILEGYARNNLQKCSKIKIWADINKKVMLRAEFYQKNKIISSLKFSDFVLENSKYWMPTKININQIDNLSGNHIVMNLYLKYLGVNQGVSDELFVFEPHQNMQWGF